MKEIKLSSEERYVLYTFKKNFKKYKDIPMAIYGVGGNTKIILENVEGYNILGLMDAESTGKLIYGKKVLSYDEVIKKVKKIVIVANKNVLNIIYKRIKFLENDYEIEIYNIEGENLKKVEDNSLVKKDIIYYNKSIVELINKIDKNDIISFDVFDTLIMRKTLRVSNIFDVVERKILEELDIKMDFKRNRIEAEIELNKSSNIPNINNIYNILKQKINISTEVKEKIKKIEIETELENIIPRKKMIEVFEYALKKGKEVYLLSDMYLPSEFMYKLLEKCGIMGYKKLLISCEINCSKHSGDLYRYYKSLLEPGKKLLHIGDNLRNDIFMAEKNSINTFHILSSYEMLLESRFKDLLISIKNIEDSNTLGLFISKAFNNPFELSGKKGKLIIDDMFKLGYLFIGPIVLNFTIWLIQQLKKSKIDKILFSARDGYLIEQVYKILTENTKIKVPKSLYFKTSRRAVAVASIINEQDIKNVMNYPFKGNKKEFLKERFGIMIDEDSDYISYKEASLESYVLEYKDYIIDNAKDERKCYMKYIKSCEILNDEKIALFDFVSSGTVQYYLSKILEKRIKGFYFIKMDSEKNFYNNSNDILSLFGECSYYQMPNNVSKYRMILESIFTDSNPSLIRVDKDGNFEYSEVKTKQFDEISRCHQGIKEFVKDMLVIDKNIIKRNIDITKSDEVLGNLNYDTCIINDEIKKTLYLDGSYTGEPQFNAWDTLF